MKRKYLILMFCVFALSAASVVSGSVFDGGWRISVGAAYNAPAKVGLQFSPAKFSCGRVVPPTTTLPSRAAAKKAVSGTKVSDTCTVFSDDGMVFVDTDDLRKAEGLLEEGTWNVLVRGDSWNADDSTFELATAEYVDIRNLHDGQGGLQLNGSDEAAMPGVTVELSRNLYHDEEYHYGVDLAFMFSYFFRTDMYKSQSYERSDAIRVQEGDWTSSIAPVSGVFEEEWLDADGYYGGGSYYGPGPSFRDVNIDDNVRSISVYRNDARFYASGDFRELEMVLALRPYYDVFEWLRLYGTIGLAVSWSEFNLDVWSQRNGLTSTYSRDYDAWDVYGIGGLGLMARWRNFCLGVDFFARFLQDDLEIQDEIVQGSLERSPWMFRGIIGYEF